AGYWAASAAGFARTMLRSSVRLRVRSGGVRLLPHAVDADAAQRALAEAGPPDDGGWIELELDVESDEVAAGQLVALGANVEVLEPPEVRRRLADLGRTLAARHA